MVLATAIVGLCTFELMSALHARGFRPAAIIALLGALTIVPLAYHRGEFAYPFMFAIVTVFTLLWFVFEVVHTRPMVNVAVDGRRVHVHRPGSARSPACCSPPPTASGSCSASRSR